MAKTRWKSKMHFSGGVSTPNMTCISTLTIPDNSLAYAKLSMTGSILFGGGTVAQTPGDMGGEMLSFTFSGASDLSVTHSLGTLGGWIVVNNDAPLASGQVVWCSDLSTSTTTLTLESLGTATIKVFVF